MRFRPAKSKAKKGGTSNKVKRWTFLTRLDILRTLALTRLCGYPNIPRPDNMPNRYGSPRILYVTRIWPRECGAHVRSLNILRALQQIGQVDVVGLNRAGSASSPVSWSEFKTTYTFDFKLRPNRGLSDKIRWTVDPKFEYPNGFAVEDEAVSRILSRLTSFDLIWFSTIHVADMFPATIWPNSVLDIDDLQSSHGRTSLKVQYHPWERFLALRKIFVWKRRERLLGQRFTLLCACSDEDRRYLAQIGVQVPVHVIPNAFEKPAAEPARNPVEPPRIGFIGFFGYSPNRDGIQWFVDHCWSRVKAAVPDARLRLIGQGSDCIRTLASPDVDSLGWLPDPSEEIRTWSAMVVPVRQGAGTRVKIAQAFSQKCPIVSTSLGAYGYGAVNGYDMFLADTPEAFSDACVRAIREPRVATEIAERAWCRFLDHWTWDAVHPRVWAAAEDCLRMRTRCRSVPLGSAKSSSTAIFLNMVV
jgi:glycosyltransferase involved in cell wall biosynthesis